MASPPSEKPRRGVRIVIVAVLLAGIACIFAAAIPADPLRRAAERAGHRDDFTSGRLVRFRLISAGLGATWAILALAGLTIGRDYVERSADALGRDLAVRRRRLRGRLGETRRGVNRRNWGWGCWSVFVCLVVGAAFRTWHLNQPIKYDEAYSYLHFARRPLYQGLLDFHVPNNHLLHTLLSHVSLRLLGDHEWSLRVPALLAGLLSVAAVWQLGKRTAGREVALLATGMTAASAVEISYSANARGYTLVAWLGLVLADRMIAVARRGRPVDWLLAGVAAVLGFYTVPTMLFCFAGALGWAIWQVATGRCYASGAAGFGRLVVFTSAVGLMSATLYSPAIAFSGLEAFEHDILTPHRLPRLFGDLADAWRAAVGSWSEGIAPAWALGAFALFGVVGLFFGRDTRGAAKPIGIQPHRGLAVACRAGAGLWLAMFLATAAVTVLSRQAPPPRVFTIVAPYFYLFAATGLLSVVSRIASRLPGLENTARYAAPVLTILVLLGGGVHVVTGAIFRHGETGRCPAARPAAAWLAAQAPGAGRVMAPLGCDVPILYYVTREQLALQWMGRPAAGETVYLLIPGDRSPREVFADPVLAPLVRGVTFGRWQRAHEFRDASLWKSVVDSAGECR